MMQIPFDIIGCSWPRPVQQHDGNWASQPEWGAPLMPVQPLPCWRMIDGEPCWTIDWREFFKIGTKPHHISLGGEMRGFHVVFHLRVKDDGKLVFWSVDGCVVGRGGQVVHSDRGTQESTRGEIDVVRGDWLQVAQWQSTEEWLWGARLAEPAHEDRRIAAGDLTRSYLGLIKERLRYPDSPPLKMYLGGWSPVRTVVALYSMVLNGCTPSKVVLFGEHQWSPEVRELFAAALPFAEVVPTEQFLEHIDDIGGSRLAEAARQHWFVMKALIALVWPPEEGCMMDDDVFVLDRVDDALEAFRRCDLVFSPDADFGGGHLEYWGPLIDRDLRLLPTGTFNAGLYWIRQFADPRSIADYALRSRPSVTHPLQWEQGLIATLYARRSFRELPTQRYFYPIFDGLPGGLVGYDYADNPCGFASIHFGGLLEKPSDPMALYLAPQILGQKPEQQICLYRGETAAAPLREAR